MSNIEFFMPKSEEIHHLNNWLFETARPFIKNRVFEVNSGDGEFSSCLVDQGFTVQLNATSDTNRETLRQKFFNSPKVRGIHQINFSSQEMESKYIHFQNHFSTVLLFNRIEEDITCDLISLTKAKRLLSTEGYLILIARCATTFFPGSAPDIEQLNRINRHWISTLLPDFKIIQVKFFDWNGACFISIAKAE